LNLVADDGARASNGPKSTKFTLIVAQTLALSWPNATFVVAAATFYVPAAAPTGQFNVNSQMSLGGRLQSTGARAAERRAGGGSPRARAASRCLMSRCLMPSCLKCAGADDACCRTRPPDGTAASASHGQKGHNLDCHPGASNGNLIDPCPAGGSGRARHSRSCGGLHANFML